MAMELAAQSAVTPATLEAVVVGGDLSKLTPAQRLEWYKARCDAAGLDPRTQPFQYLSLQGKLTLYATKTATDQIISSRGLTVEIIDRQHDRDAGIYEVQCRVVFPDGRHVEDFAAVNVMGKKGDDLCNAIMKAVTKAKRRTVLSACGLGMLDESETETIKGARSVAVNMETGEVIDAKVINSEPSITREQSNRIGELVEELELSQAKAKEFLKEVTGKSSRSELTEQEAAMAIEALEIEICEDVEQGAA